MHALVFTDLVDSTALVERLGDVAAARLWSEHDASARALLARHGGREIDRSDGFFLLFTDVASAAAFALGYHDACAKLGVSARVGVHAGAVVLRTNAPEDVARGAKPLEVDGLAKPVAARVMSLAAGGQTLLTEAAREQSTGSLQPGTRLDDHGHYRLKGLDEPVHVFAFGPDAAPARPPTDAEKAYRVVRRDDHWQPLRAVPTNLVPERDAFVGRARELHQLSRRLDDGARLVTLLGVGGTGKTRLARRHGGLWLGDWPGGVYFCDLSEARSVDGICFAIARALGVPLGAGDAVGQLGHAIAALGRCLLILDNMEQVVAHAAETLGRWLDRTDRAAFVATSRERMLLGGEEVLPLEPLALDSDAVELFVVRARAHRPGFELDGQNRDAVARLVSLLDGLPLAIELAAARVRVLSPMQIVQRLTDRFGLLAVARDAPARQATLRAAIDWSWELLSPWEQAALAQCSVFEGGFSIEAAEAVLDLSAWPSAPMPLDVVQALVDKSLLRAWLPRDATARHDLAEPYFGMYISIHEYAAQRLHSDRWGTRARAEQRHGDHYAAAGRDEALEALVGHDSVRRRRLLALDLDNLVAACRRAVAREDGATAVPCCRAAWEVLELQGPFAVGAELARSVCRLPTLTDEARAAALLTAAQATRRTGAVDAARGLLVEALDHASAAGSMRLEAQRLLALASLERECSRYADAIAALDAARPLFERLGLRRGVAQVLTETANIDKEQGRVEQADRNFREALALHRAVGNRRAEAITQGSLGLLCAERGRLDEALQHYREAMAVHEEVGNRAEHGLVLGNMGIAFLDRGRLDEAWERFEASIAATRGVGNRRYEGFVLNNMSLVRAMQGRMAEAATLGEAALAVHREVGNRRSAGIVLANLSALYHELGRSDEAQGAAEQGLAIHRELGNRRSEAVLVGHMALVLMDAGRIHEAAERIAPAVALAREIGDKVNLGQCLVTLGRVQWLRGEHGASRETLAELEALAADVGAGPGSNLHSGIATLKATMAT